MKIAILTLPLRSNYGGILQAYALQTELERLGHKVTFLDRQRSFQPFKLLFFRVLSCVKCFFLRYFMGKKDIYVNNPFSKKYTIYKIEDIDINQISLFIQNRIHRSQLLTSSYALRKEVCSNMYDVIIVGSDQVWREEYSPCITDYFLGFLPSDNKIKKIVYAASFGRLNNAISRRKFKRCASLAKRFDAISVRETASVDFIREKFKVKASFVLDPTLLLSLNDYMKLIDFKLVDRREKKIVCYILDDSIEKQNILQTISEKLRMKVQKINEKDSTGRLKSLISIERWLTEFYCASFIVTDSFHGCVFSIIFRKNFVVIDNLSSSG